MKENILKTIILDWHNSPIPIYRKRLLSVPLDTGKIISIVGPRRAGKTAYCYNLIQTLLENGRAPHQILYINFEDERLDRETAVLEMVLQQYQALYPALTLSDCVFVFDEIQNIPKWELFIRRVYDTLCKQIIITGSNSTALGKDIATSLRGRTLTYEILPLSFAEYLMFHDVRLSPKTTQDIARVQHLLDRFLINGGFPETIFFDATVHRKTLQDYFEVMMYKDLGERAKIADSALLRLFLKRCFSSVCRPFSTHKLYNELKSAGYKIGKNTVYELVDICRNAYLYFTVPKYASKVANIELGEKKLFAIDNGLLNALGLVLPHEMGKLLEHAVYLACYRRSPHGVFFDSNGYECDFLLGEWDQIHTAIQVTESLEDPDVYRREIKGLVHACKKFKLQTGLILTTSTEDRLVVEGIAIRVMPVWKWFLEGC